MPDVDYYARKSEEYREVRFKRACGYEIEIEFTFSTNYFARTQTLGRHWATFPRVVFKKDLKKVYASLQATSTITNRNIQCYVLNLSYGEEPEFAKLTIKDEEPFIETDLKKPESIKEYLKAFEEVKDAANLRNAFIEVIRLVKEVMKEDPPKQ